MSFDFSVSKKEVEDFVKLRISNTYLFSGRKNSSKWAWRYVKILRKIANMYKSILGYNVVTFGFTLSDWSSLKELRYTVSVFI